MSNRREFITLLSGAAAAWPLAARAQPTGRSRRIGVLVGYSQDDLQTKERLVAFRQELERRGWLEGRNLIVDYRYAPAARQVQIMAKELIALQPDLIFAQATPIVAELHRESRAIPIVFVGVGDPIGWGFVESLAHPGGNLTGLIMFEASIVGKWLDMLKEIAPSTKRAALVLNPKTTAYDYILHAAEALAPSLAIELVPCPIENAADIEKVIATFAQVPDGGLVLPADITTTVHRDLIVALAARHRLPAVYSDRLFVAAGGLICYSLDRTDQFRAAASYVDRILRGTKPADLPVQAPTKYETVINLKTAKTLGLTVPSGLLVAADEVIE